MFKVDYPHILSNNEDFNLFKKILTYDVVLAKSFTIEEPKSYPCVVLRCNPGFMNEEGNLKFNISYMYKDELTKILEDIGLKYKELNFEHIPEQGDLECK